MTSPYGTGVTGTYPISGNSNIDPLVWPGYKWGASGPGTSATVTYSFPTISSTWSTDYAIYLNNEPFNNFQPFTAAQQTAAKQALALWSEVANITFQQVTETSSNVGDIRFGNSGAVTNSPAAAWAYTPYDDNTAFEYPESGDVWFDKALAPNLQLLPGQFGFATMLHEIGHAIGLDHPFYDGWSFSEPVLDPSLDTDQYTVMSYTYEQSTMAYASTPQLLDILAIQYIYGANMTTRTGNDTYTFSATTEVNKSIWDAGGNDTIDLSNQTTNSLINLNEGTYSQFCRHPAVPGYGPTSSLLGIAYGVTIENANGGSGADTIHGNAVANRLSGGGGTDTLRGYSGNDYLDGGTGADSMIGGSGNDTYVVDAALDVVNEEGNADTGDLVRSSITINLTTLASGRIEHAVLLGSAAINATGNAGNNMLTGNIAANILDGGVGADIMAGGNGADTYIVDNIGDKVSETTGGATGGIDLVKSSITFSLGANVENLTLTGLGNINGVGNDLNNIIIGNNGANRLDGGVGNDTMTGGKGNDTYVVSAIGDIVNETVLNSVGGGVDKVESAVTYSLATRTNIENLTLTGTGKINGTGNALANIIIGNSNDNILDGGVGADTVKGGAGNDTYVVNSLADIVDEQGNTDSADQIKTSALITSAIAGVENYTFTGAAAWSFTGNAANNQITGGAYNDTLNGADGNDTLLGNGGNDTLLGGIGNDWLDGGAGLDKLKGGAGNDTYVYAAGDVIDEQGNVDTDDLVRTTITVNLLTLASGAIENAILLGATAINATGNNADNELTGNVAANILNGGVGADIMAGGNGADTYIVDNVGDKVTETTGGAVGGIDLVQSAISFNLGANLENLTLLGSANINGTGNGLNNILIGNGGANILDGGAGNDTMTGGKGSDTYVVNSVGDVVNEAVLNSAGGGVDTVMSAVSFSLATRTNIEHLTLLGGGNISGTGNALDNQITGNIGQNVLNGGTGNDILNGKDGNDTLTGGAGQDKFDFDLVSELGDADIVTDFIKGTDKLDITDLLVGYNNHFDEYVSFTYSGTTTNVFVDADGLGLSSTTTLLASLLNVHLTSADSASFIVDTV